MKGYSDTKPNFQFKSAGKTQILYNIVSKEVTGMDGKTKTIWEYNYVEVEGTVTKTKVTEAMQKADANADATVIVPDDISKEYSDAKSELALSVLSQKTYPQADAYIDANVTDLASARTFLKKLTRVVLAMLKIKL